MHELLSLKRGSTMRLSCPSTALNPFKDARQGSAKVSFVRLDGDAVIKCTRKVPEPAGVIWQPDGMTPVPMPSSSDVCQWQLELGGEVRGAPDFLDNGQLQVQEAGLYLMTMRVVLETPSILGEFSTAVNVDGHVVARSIFRPCPPWVTERIHSPQMMTDVLALDAKSKIHVTAQSLSATSIEQGTHMLGLVRLSETTAFTRLTLQPKFDPEEPFNWEWTVTHTTADLVDVSKDEMMIREAGEYLVIASVPYDFCPGAMDGDEALRAQLLVDGTPVTESVSLGHPSFTDHHFHQVLRCQEGDIISFAITSVPDASEEFVECSLGEVAHEMSANAQDAVTNDMTRFVIIRLD